MDFEEYVKEKLEELHDCMKANGKKVEEFTVVLAVVKSTQKMHTRLWWFLGTSIFGVVLAMILGGRG